jgi:curved DNA-binding protein CbpA
MDTKKDYYSILGVVPSVDDVALTAVYRALLKKYHPDVFKGSKAEAERRTKEINEAYEVLGNPDKRRAYDNARKDSGFGNHRQEERNAEARYQPFQEEQRRPPVKKQKKRERVTILGLIVLAGYLYFQFFVPSEHNSRKVITAQQNSSNEVPGANADVVRRETYAFIRATNLPNETSLTYFQDKYADQVSYYGKYFSRNGVISDKRTFFLKWPNRNYTIDPASLVVDCQSTTSCQANGTFTWSDAGKGMTSTGSATFSFGWIQDGTGTWRINSEASQVLRRQVLHSETGIALQHPATP